MKSQKTAISLMLVFAAILVLQSTSAKYSGFEPNINRMITSYKVLIEDVERGFTRMLPYFEGLNNYQSNEELFTPTFADNLNYLLESSEQAKSVVYDSAQQMVAESYLVYRSRSIFYDFMAPKHKDLLAFLASVPAEDMDNTLRDLFLEFVRQKNMFFFDAKALRTNVRNCAVNLVNLFDFLEIFMGQTVREGNSYRRLVVRDLKNYYYVTGFLEKLRTFYQQHNELLEGINRSFLSLEKSLNDFDEFFESLEFYYERRYVEGVPEDRVDDLNLSDDGKEEDEAGRDPVDYCDNVLLNNYGVQGLSRAQEVSLFDEYEECPEIRNACCSQTEVTRMFKQYQAGPLATLQQKSKLASLILDKVLSNYMRLNEIGYDIVNSSEADQSCIASARKIIFTPISRDFVDKFHVFMNNAHEFLSRSRASVYCFVCDYDFHKTAAEMGEVKLSREFCSSMMTNVYDFSVVFNLQLIDYFNSIVELLQCEENKGQRANQAEFRFEHNERLDNLLNDCDERREYCEDFCKEFSFARINSVVDLDLKKLRSFYVLLEQKFKNARIDFDGEINRDYFSVVTNKYFVERNDLGTKSIDNLGKRFLDEVVDKAARNPFTTGTNIVKMFDREEIA